MVRALRFDARDTQTSAATILDWLCAEQDSASYGSDPVFGWREGEAIALSSLSPTPAGEGSMQASARRSVYLIDRY